MLKVGISKIGEGKGKTKNKFLDYASIPYDKDGYADAMKYCPSNYDLLQMVTDGGRIRMGWWTGNEYYSRKLKPEESVIAWKKAREFI